MSRLNIDQLFKTKLKNLEQTPSPEAWGKLEAMMAQNKNKVLYFRLRIAASISIVLLSGWVIWSSQQSIVAPETPAQLAEQTDNQNQSVENKAKTEEASITETEKVSTVPPIKILESESQNIARKTKKTGEKQTVKDLEVEQKNKVTETKLNIPQETMIAQVPETPVDQELMKQVKETLPPVMIIYKSALTEGEAVASVDENSEKITWNAVLAVARDFKEGNLSLGSKIKEAKEDLFNIRIRTKDNSK